jgi:hypothetical protein
LCGVGMRRNGYANIGREDPAHWHQCADQARRAADQETDPTASETLLEIAEAYEKLAALAEAKLNPTLPE